MSQPHPQRGWDCKKRNGANSALRARKRWKSLVCKRCATHRRRSNFQNMNCNFDLDCLLGAKPKIQRNNGRFVKGMIPHNKGKKWDEWMDGRQQKKVIENLRLGRKNGNPDLPGWNKKQVVGISIDGKACIFESSKDVERKLGIESRNVRGCCEGKRNLAGGLFFMWAENWNGKTELTDEQKRKYEIAMKRKETKWEKTQSAH